MMCRVIAPLAATATADTSADGDLPLDLRSVMHDVAQLLAGAAHERGVEVTCAVPRALATRFRADAATLHRLLRLLLGRAILLADAGQIVLRARVLAETASTAELRFSVKGSGVAAAGYGTVVDLGVEQCRQLASAMRGRAGLDSEPGRGGILWCSVVLDKAVPEARAAVPLTRTSRLPVADVVRAIVRRARFLRRRTGRWFFPPVHPVPRRATAWPQNS
jgi:hypothetical protein